MKTSIADPVQLAHSTWVWAATIVPLVGAPASAEPPTALLRALAGDAAEGTALQIRYVKRSGGRSDPVEVQLVGRARTQAEAEALARLVALTLPPAVELHPVLPTEVAATIVPFELDELEARSIAEIRRVVEPVPGGLPIVFPWPVGDGDVTTDAPERSLVRSVAGSESPVVLCLHAERTTVSSDVLADLQSVVSQLRDDVEVNPDPVSRTLLAAHRAWLRGLPRAALSIRLALVSSGPLTPGLTDLIGHALLGDRPYEVARPASRHEIDLAVQMLDECRAGRWGADRMSDHDELRFCFVPVDAGQVLKLPTTFDRGTDASTAPARAADQVVSFAVAAQQLRRAVDGGTPVLVIDLAHGDYERVSEELRLEGTHIRRIRLDAELSAFDPFAVPAGSSRHAHAGRVLAAMDVAYGMSTSSTAAWTVLSRAVYDAYEAASPGVPCITDLIGAAEAVLVRVMGRESARGEDLRASVLGRLELLERGPLGGLLTPGVPHDWSELLGATTVIELGALSGHAERMFVGGLLVAGLRSHREGNPLPPGRQHLVIIGGGDALISSLASGAEFFTDLATIVGPAQSVLFAARSGETGAGPLRAPDTWRLPSLEPLVLTPMVSANFGVS